MAKLLHVFEAMNSHRGRAASIPFPRNECIKCIELGLAIPFEMKISGWSKIRAPRSFFKTVHKLLMMLMLLHHPGRSEVTNLIAKVDLRQYNFRVGSAHSKFGEYTQILFLSDDLVVVSINQRGAASSGSFFTDLPESTLLIYDLKSDVVSALKNMPIEKSPEAVVALSNKRFALLNESGVQFCDIRLKCGPPIVTAGPIAASPMGTAMCSGGNRQSPVRVFDSVTFKDIEVFDRIRGSLKIIAPGDNAIAITSGRRFTVVGGSPQVQPAEKCLLRWRDGTTTVSPIDEDDLVGGVRFLNDQYVSGISVSRSRALIAGITNGRHLEYDVDTRMKSILIPCLSGLRFGIYEYGLSSRAPAVNGNAVNDDGVGEAHRIRVVNLTTGQEEAEYHWVTKSLPIKPALSPSGIRVAYVQNGFLEVHQMSK